MSEATFILTMKAPICRNKLPMMTRIAQNNNITVNVIDLDTVDTKEDLENLHLHGIPTIRYKDKEIFGDFSERDVSTLFATDLE